MAVERVIRDPDDKWQFFIDWNNWKAELEADTGATVTITGSVWTVPSDLVEETETPTDDINGLAFLIGSGGTAGTEYEVINQITYQFVVGGLYVALTQSRSAYIQIEEM